VTTSPLLAVDGLWARYDRIFALQDIDLTVGEGEIVTIIGANGAGKTTLLKVLSGLLPAARGAVRYDGRDLVGRPCHEIVAGGVVQVPEGRMVLKKMSVRDNLLVGPHSRPAGEDLAADLQQVFDRFPILRERQHQPAGTLSGGQQQMLVLGRALMARPRLLMLDEPSLGLAPIIVSQIFEIIGELRTLGLTVLLVEQNARKALQVSDRAYVLELGRIATAGRSADLARDPAVVRSYLGGGPG